MKIHGSDKRRGWVKLHAAVDPKTQELISIEITDDKTTDSTVLLRLIHKAPKTARKVLADGACDKANCPRFLSKKGIEDCISLRTARRA